RRSPGTGRRGPSRRTLLAADALPSRRIDEACDAVYGWQPVRRMRRLPLAVLLLGLVVALALPAAADASSIVFTRTDGNVWLINPDGSGLFQVTLDGSAGNPYETPSQAD